MVCAPSRHSARQAACRKGVAIQPSGLRRDVAGEGLSEQHTSGHEAGNSGRRTSYGGEAGSPSGGVTRTGVSDAPHGRVGLIAGDRVAGEACSEVEAVRSTIPDLARRATALWWWRNWGEQEFFLPCPPSVALTFDDEARLFEAGDGSAGGSELGVGELGGPSAVEIGREVGDCGARVILQVAQDFALEAA